MINKPYKILYSEEQIAQRISTLAESINKDYQNLTEDNPLIVIVVLKGAFIFAADLVRRLKVPLRMEFIGVSSYVGTKSTGHVRITNDLTAEIKDHHILVVEDIIETGTTIDFLMKLLQVREPSSTKICSLLSKPHCHQMSHKVDYSGFEISDEFVIGYGLDLDGSLRQTPYLVQMI
ncbi:MAG: hypoxanthine phosphoribosyltransferase [Oligoflexales bacterium]|nr:hypoxanthine phosphoribosyltransferase [Oligoflexales bacterium]